MRFIFLILDWFVLRYALPYAKKRSFLKKKTRTTILQYEEIMRVIHVDKLDNKPGVYVFVAKNHEDGTEKGGFLLGKETVENIDGASQHFLMTLAECDEICVSRLICERQENGDLLQYLRSLKDKTILRPLDGDWCKAKAACANIFSDPGGLCAPSRVLFEYKGD